MSITIGSRAVQPQVLIQSDIAFRSSMSEELLELRTTLALFKIELTFSVCRSLEKESSQKYYVMTFPVHWWLLEKYKSFRAKQAALLLSRLYNLCYLHRSVDKTAIAVFDITTVRVYEQEVDPFVVDMQLYIPYA